MEWSLWPVVWFTFWQSSLVTTLSIVFGGGLAVIERYNHWRTPNWFLAVATLPLFLPALVVGTSFIHLFGNAGDVNALFHWLHLPKLQILYQPSAVILGHLYYNLPLAYLAMRTALQSLSRHTEESAQTLGATPWQLLTTVWWPQLRSSVAGIAAVIFIYCWTSFALPLQLGGSHAKTLEVWLYEQLVLYHHQQLVVIVALIQLFMFTVPIVFVWKQQTIHQPHTPSHQTNKHPGLYLLLSGVWLLPLVSLISHTMMNWNATTWSQVQHSEFFPSLITVAALTIATLLTVVAATHMLRLSARWLLILLAISPITLAGIWLVTIGQGLASLALAYVFGLLPLAYYFIQERRHRYGIQYQTAAQTLGANWWQQRLLEWQWLQPARNTIIAITVVFIFGDITYSSLLAPTEHPTTMQVAYGLLSSYRSQAGSLAMCLILLIIISLQILIYVRNSKATI